MCVLAYDCVQLQDTTQHWMLIHTNLTTLTAIYYRGKENNTNIFSKFLLVSQNWTEEMINRYFWTLYHDYDINHKTSSDKVVIWTMCSARTHAWIVNTELRSTDWKLRTDCSQHWWQCNPFLHTTGTTNWATSTWQMQTADAWLVNTNQTICVTQHCSIMNLWTPATKFH